MPYRSEITDEMKVIDPKTLQDIQESFAHSTGLGVVFTDRDGNHLGEGSNFSEFCREVNKTESGLQSCFRSNRAAAAQALAKNGPLIFTCHAGLIDIIIPLVIDGSYVGTVMAGQIHCSDCNRVDFPPIGVRDQEAPWYREKRYEVLRDNVTVMSKQRIEAAANALFMLANYIVDKNIRESLEKELLRKQEILFQEEKNRTMLEHSLKVAQLNAMQKQINPHFMFNILSAISRLIDMGDIVTAQNVLDIFNKMLRYSLHSKSNIVTLRQEISYIEKYLYLQNFRFNDRVNYTISVTPSLYDLCLPFFSLQVFVENSIIHGLEPVDREGIIRIDGQDVDGEYVITIEDNGIGMADEELEWFLQKATVSEGGPLDYTKKENHFGLSNTIERLQLHFGSSFSFSVDSSRDRGTRVLLRIQKDDRFMVDGTAERPAG